MRVILVLIVSVFFGIAAIAQREMPNAPPQPTSSVYDPSSIYYNEGTLAISVDIGYFGYLSTQLYNEYNSIYNNSDYSISPVYNTSIDFGVTPKSAFGIGISYQQAETYNYNYTNLLSQNVFVVNFGVRYTHCMGSWNFLYYGFRVGTSFFNSNLIVPSSITLPPNVSASSSSEIATIQFLIGLRITFSKHIMLHIEGGALAPYTIDGGLTFRITAQKSIPSATENNYGGHGNN